VFKEDLSTRLVGLSIPTYSASYNLTKKRYEQLRANVKRPIE